MREPYGTIYSMVSITMKRSEGHCGRRHTPLVGVTIRSDCSDTIIATSKTASFAIINYLQPPPLPLLVTPVPSTAPNSTTTSKEDAAETSLSPATPPSMEEALNNRSEESKIDEGTLWYWGY